MTARILQLIDQDKMKKYQKYIINNLPVVVTLFTGYAYMCCYAFEVGFCNVYDIPLTFIDVSLNNVLKSVLILLVGGGFLILLLTGIGQVIRHWFRRLPMIGIFLSWNFAAVVLFLTPIASTFINIEDWVIIGGTSELIFFVLFRQTIKLNLKAKKRFIKKYSQIPGTTKESKLAAFVDDFIIKSILKLASLGFFAIMIIIFSYQASTLMEENNFSSPYFKLNTTFVFIKRYNDNIIFKDYDTTRHRYKDSLLILKTSETSNLILTHGGSGMSLQDFKATQPFWSWGIDPNTLPKGKK